MKFSYLEYSNIIKHIQQYLDIVDFASVTSDSDNYCVVRHDVEFSPYRALEIAKLENDIGISSSFYFQITNNCYNSLSNENLAIIKQIEDLGHKIGAHINTSYIERVNKKELSVKSDHYIHIVVAPTKSSQRFEWFVEKDEETYGTKKAWAYNTASDLIVETAIAWWMVL